MPQLQSNTSSQRINDFEFHTHKFIRRTDLSEMDRIHIAYTALLAQQYQYWGVITQLSEEYMISRTFVYMLADTLSQTGTIIFGNNSFDQTDLDPKTPFHHMLSLRMEGRCSIGATATDILHLSVNTFLKNRLEQNIWASFKKYFTFSESVFRFLETSSKKVLTTFGYI